MTVSTRTRFGVTAPPRLVLCAALVAAADFLFYGRPVGWTLGLICALLPFSMATLSPPAIQAAGCAGGAALTERRGIAPPAIPV